MTHLHQPYERAGLTLRNRVAMAPMTRSRAIGNLPNALMADYYGQRAGAGLVITEGTAPSPEALGYARIPGLFDEAQRAGWAAIADAVHAGGAQLYVQLMHAGRIGHPDNLPRGAVLLGPSAVAAAGTIWTDANGQQPHPAPKAMDAGDLVRVRAACHEIYGECTPPPGAIVHYDGHDPRLGKLVKYAILESVEERAHGHAA